MIASNNIFDCNIHPTVNGLWNNGEQLCEFSEVSSKLNKAKFSGGVAVGLPNIGGYNHDDFILKCNLFNFIPVAAWIKCKQEEIADNIKNIKAMGYKGIKIHPRFLGFVPSERELINIFGAACKFDIRVLFCTYPCYSSSNFYPNDLLGLLQAALVKTPELPLMLMHSGGVELLRYIEFARANPNIVLDLSYTILKYEGSSIDLDLNYAFNNFDRRIVIGSDYPDYSFEELKTRFDKLAEKIDRVKRENIAWRNAKRFYGL